MKRMLLAIAIALVLACSKREPATTETTDARQAIEIAYVGSPEMKVHAAPGDASRVVTTFLNGETVSILSRRGDWAEVRTASGSGWAHADELTTAAAAKAEQDNPTPKFRVSPSPVTVRGAKGTIAIDASVNSDGDVTSTQLIINTTGSAKLAARNAEALMHAKFYPIVIKGQKKEFIYSYRIDY